MTRYDEAQYQALSFLNAYVSDCIGVIDNECKLAAAVLYCDMERDGLLVSKPSREGPVYSLTPKGHAKLSFFQGEFAGHG